MQDNNYLKDKFREDVFKEIENYIGYVYADDYHSCDKLIVNPFDMSVSHGVRIGNSTQIKMDYFDTFGLIKRSGTFTFEPDPIGIECVVQHYYPDEQVTKFVEKTINVINDFLKEHGYSKEAVIGYPIDTYEASVYCPSEVNSHSEEIDPDNYDNIDDYIDEMENCVSVEKYPLAKYVRNTRSNGFVPQKDRILRLAVQIKLLNEEY